jgi:phage-related protein/DNA-binding XRE family transcriptional regulator
MDYKFRVEFLEEAKKFLDSLNEKTRAKIIYNIWKSRSTNDKELFKKLEGEIWEFRTKYNKSYYRLFAFWDKTVKEDTVVISTNGLIKKTDKTPKSEIQKAEKLKDILTKKQKMKTYSLEQLTDKYIGKKGTKKRNEFDNELRLDLLGQTIKQVRLERNLTQEQLGELVGVKKAQISKIENSATDARFATILKVFKALDAKVNFNVEVKKRKLAY